MKLYENTTTLNVLFFQLWVTTLSLTSQLGQLTRQVTLFFLFSFFYTQFIYCFTWVSQSLLIIQSLLNNISRFYRSVPLSIDKDHNRNMLPCFKLYVINNWHYKIINVTTECKSRNLILFPEIERPNRSTLHPYKVQQHKIWVHFHKCGSRKSTAVYFCHCCTQVN